jgi:hypothetical protein
MRPKDRSLAARLDDAFRAFDKQIYPLPGIIERRNRECFIEQVLESVHRVQYVSVICNRTVSNLRTDPSSDLFDPLKAAVLRKRQGQIDEAFWFVFLFVHFGKSPRSGWRLVRDVYGCLGGAAPWDWARTSADPRGFRMWLAAHEQDLTGGFGNHRKYESLHALSRNGTGEAVETYVQWVSTAGNHNMLVQQAEQPAAGDPRKMFDWLYRSMNSVARFGRTAKFDYLTMIGKMGLAPIDPGSTYMEGATGPFAGASLLFGVSKPSSAHRATFDGLLVQLEANLGVGMQVIEDALCNWQKSPAIFKPFRG